VAVEKPAWTGVKAGPAARRAASKPVQAVAQATAQAAFFGEAWVSIGISAWARRRSSAAHIRAMLEAIALVGRHVNM
jgi:hypothetical protein